MKHISIEYGTHPVDEYKHIKVTWLRVEDPKGHCISRMNVYCPEVLQFYLGHELDMFEYIQALELLKPFLPTMA